MVGLGSVFAVLEPRGIMVEVRTSELMVEEKGDVGHGFEGVKKTFVQPRAIDGVD